MGVVYHAPERHPFCDSPINIVVCLIVIPPLSDAAYYMPKNPPHGRVRAYRLSVRRACCHSPTHPQPSFNRHTNHLSIAIQPPLSRASPASPPICRDKDGHPSHAHRPSASSPHIPTPHQLFTRSAHTNYTTTSTSAIRLRPSMDITSIF